MVLSLYSGCAIADSSNKKIILISLYFVEFGTKEPAFRGRAREKIEGRGGGKGEWWSPNGRGFQVEV